MAGTRWVRGGGYRVVGTGGGGYPGVYGQVGYLGGYGGVPGTLRVPFPGSPETPGKARNQLFRKAEPGSRRDPEAFPEQAKQRVKEPKYCKSVGFTGNPEDSRRPSLAGLNNRVEPGSTVGPEGQQVGRGRQSLLSSRPVRALITR